MVNKSWFDAKVSEIFILICDDMRNKTYIGPFN